jgi:hypothetical protein
MIMVVCSEQRHSWTSELRLLNSLLILANYELAKMIRAVWTEYRLDSVQLVLFAFKLLGVLMLDIANTSELS